MCLSMKPEKPISLVKTKAKIDKKIIKKLGLFQEYSIGLTLKH